MIQTKETLKRVYDQMPQRLAEIDSFIQSVTKNAYGTIRLTANESLCRNPHTSTFLNNALFDTHPQHPALMRVCWGLFKYYAINMGLFFLWVANYTTYRLFIAQSQAQTFKAAKGKNFIVDVFIFVQPVLREERYSERCFPGLTETLKNRGHSVTILPKFLGRLTPLRLLRLNTILRNTGYKFITEFDLLHWGDLVRYFSLLLLYPFDVIKLAARCKKDKRRISKLLGAELLKSIDTNVSHIFVRYLVGKRLHEITTGSTTYLVNWFENQVIDKALFRGIREKQSSIYIFGVQSFITYPTYLCRRVAESDALFGMTPDVVLANSAIYADHPSSVKQRVGVSFRSRELFHQTIYWELKHDAAIFLPFQCYLSKDVIAVSAQAPTLRNQSIFVTVHPASLLSRLPSLPAGWEYTNQSRFDLLRTAAIVISSDSSTAVEAAALGTSVIIIASQSSFTCNPMLEEGRGELWDIAFDGEDVEFAYHHLISYRCDHPERIRILAEYYKNQCFVEPTEANIEAAFELEPKDKP